MTRLHGVENEGPHQNVIVTRNHWVVVSLFGFNSQRQFHTIKAEAELCNIDRILQVQDSPCIIFFQPRKL